MGSRRLAQYTLLVGVLAASLLGSLGAAFLIVSAPTTKRLAEYMVVVAVGGIALQGLRHPRSLLIALAIMAFFDFPVHVLGAATELTEIALYIVVIALLPYIRVRAVPMWLKVSGTCLVAGSAIATAVAALTGPALAGTMRWMLTLACLLAAFHLFPRTLTVSRRLARLVTVMGALLAVGALAQKAGVDLLVGAPYSAGRVNSFIGYYTAFAGIMAIVLCAGFGELVQSIRQGDRPLAHGICLVLVTVALVIPLSRGGLIAGAAGLALFTAWQVRQPKTLVAIGAAFVCLTAVVLLLVPSTIAQYEQRFTTSQGADQVRQAQQAAGFKGFTTHPLGIGYGNFRAYASSSSVNLQEALAHSHETFLQIGLDDGWLGLLGYLGLIGGGIVVGLRTRNPLGAGYAAALASILVQGVNDYQYFEIPYFLLTAILIFGACCSEGMIEMRRVPPGDRLTRYPGTSRYFPFPARNLPN